MAEEPQPSNIQEGDTGPEAVPAGGEERKAAAAMSKLDQRGDDDAAPKKELDTKALGDAMSKLDVGGKKDAGDKKTAETPKKVVKVDQADVSLLVEQLDLSKTKATELLKAHDADAVKAMTAWVTASS